MKEVNRDFIRLILRSPDKGDGWRSISEMLSKLAMENVNKTPELFETKEDDGLHVRLSEQGKVIADYL